MTITSTTSTSDGVTATFSVPFPFFSRDDVEVLVDGAAYGGTVTWLSDSSISLSPIPASGVKVTRRRVTPDTPARASFTNANISATGLNANQTQNLYLAQERAADLARTVKAPHGEDGPSLQAEATRDGGVAWFDGAEVKSAVISPGQVLGGHPTTGVPISVAQNFVVDVVVGSVASRFAAAAASWPAEQTFIRTAGYLNVGDGGGALYRRAASEPAHPGKFEDADGVWWELAETTVTPEMLGATGAVDGDDSQAIIDALATLAAGGILSLKPGRTYRMLRGNGALLADTIVSDNITIEGNGATIHGLPASGVIANSSYNQFYNIFQATGRRGLRFRNLKTTGACSTAALYGCTNVRFDDPTDNGALAQGLTNPLVVTGITQANPGVLTYTGTDPENGDFYTITGVVGMTEINDQMVRVSNVNTGAKTFELLTSDGGAAVNTSGYTPYVSGGAAALCSNWLRDKGIYLKECDDVVVTNPSLLNCAFGIYTIGDQATTRCGTVKVIGGVIGIDAEDYTAAFPAGVYWVDVEDGLTQGVTFKNLYSSVRNGDTGSGQGYGIYEGDGQSGSIKSIGDHFIAVASAGRAMAAVYVSEPDAFTFDSPTYAIHPGANFTALARFDAKRVNTSYVLKGINAVIPAGVPCYGVTVVGAAGNVRAPKISLKDSTIIGGLHAFRVEGLGNATIETGGNIFEDQTSPEGSVYFYGEATNPHKRISMRGDRVAGSEGPNVRFAAYCISPKLHDCDLLDANLGGAAGDLASNVVFSSASFGSDIKDCLIGNTVMGGGLASYGVTNANNTSDRIFKDIAANNTFVGLDNGSEWRRFATAAPVHGLFDLAAGDVVENSALGAGGIPRWHSIYTLRPSLTADASSASATISIQAGYASSISAGMPVLLTKTADPYGGDYADATKWHLDTVASVNVPGNTITLTTGIDAGDGNYVAGTARIVVGFFRAGAAIS